MQYWLLNRLAQRYLVRRGGQQAAVGIPGPDLFETSAWQLQQATNSDGYHLIAASAPRFGLAPRGESVIYDHIAADNDGSWTIEAVGDDSKYCYFASAAEPHLVLGVVADNDEPNGFRLVLQSHRDRAAMWLLSEDCVADARSIHLRYATPPGVSLFYNEVYPDPTPRGTFFCTSGFGANARGRDPSGYAGVQRLEGGMGLAIFSVWHRMIDDVRSQPDSLATAVGAHPEAEVTSFSGEGSGSSIRLPIDWLSQGSRRVRFVLTAEALDRDTVITAYIGLGRQPWLNLGAIVRAETQGGLMAQPYAFIEDFVRSGNRNGVAIQDRSPYQRRSARFANQWYRASDGALAPVTESTFTVYSPHPLENVAASPPPQGESGLWIATGGSSSEGPPPIGAIFGNDASVPRQRPDLTGVPYR